MNTRPIVFFDFDGTITRTDVVDSILQVYADPAWLLIEEEWKAGRIGSRACLRSQMNLVRARPEELDALLDGIEVDEGFATVLDTCARHHVGMHIISDGFDYCIDRVLGRPALALKSYLPFVEVFASHLEPQGHTWNVEFPYFPLLCSHGCATCKPAVMDWLNPGGASTIFVGDGLSDRYAATNADLVFGKSLSSYCQEHGITYVGYTDLGEIAPQLEELTRASTSSRCDRPILCEPMRKHKGRLLLHE
jgi:2-hydroxy-3-keto-5-methylthiopentenyl-1-phosphate phosphatase